MTYENIKSVILVLLVSFSVFLTWSIWTYKPNYELMEKPNTVEKVVISAKKDVEQIIKPDRIYYHYDKEKHFGTVNPNEITKTLNEISKWNFADFENVSDQIKNYSSFTHANGNAVILFPDSIPIELYKTIIDVKDSKLPQFYFDRIVIDSVDTAKDQGLVYFISTKHKQAYRSHVPVSFVQSFRNSYYKNAEFSTNFVKYMPFKISNEHVIYLSTEESKMLRYQLIAANLESEKFKNALFKDPSVVQKNYQPYGEEYTNGSSLMRVNTDKSTLSYVNPAEINESNYFSKNLLKRGIDFVNEHGGWTGNYRFVEMDEKKQTVLFRLYDDKGYPVFSENSGISEISQIWGQNNINQYLRSNFSLGLRMETTETILPSGQDIIKYLETKEDFDLNNLQDVVLGYTMTKQSQTRSVYLEPSWYYKYNNTWKQIAIEDAGGDVHGLE